MLAQLFGELRRDSLRIDPAAVLRREVSESRTESETFDLHWGSSREFIAPAGLHELQATSDTDAAALADLIRGWEEMARNNGGRCTVVQAVADLQADTSGKRYEALRSAIAEFCPTKVGIFPSTKSLGRLLSRFRDRVVGGKAIVMAKDRGEHGREWAVKSVGQSGRPEGAP